MLCDEAEMRVELKKLVAHVSSEPALREDLLQEAIIHLWQEESRRPNQTRSWYIQNCKFHLQHFLGRGRSVDAFKRRRNGAVTLELPLANGGEDGPACESNLFLISDISAREIVGLASRKLRARSRAVLECLADGMGAREIARKLKISHPAAIRHRRVIAALLMKLGIAPPMHCNGHSENHRNGHIHCGNGHAQRVNGHAPALCNGAMKNGAARRGSPAIRILQPPHPDAERAQH